MPMGTLGGLAFREVLHLQLIGSALAPPSNQSASSSFVLRILRHVLACNSKTVGWAETFFVNLCVIHRTAETAIGRRESSWSPVSGEMVAPVSGGEAAAGIGPRRRTTQHCRLAERGPLVVAGRPAEAGSGAIGAPTGLAHTAGTEPEVALAADPRAGEAARPRREGLPAWWTSVRWASSRLATATPSA